jgi:hypothetical protein
MEGFGKEREEIVDPISGGICMERTGVGWVRI